MGKLTAQTEITTLTTGDLLYGVDDPSGTPASKKVTIDNVLKALETLGTSSGNVSLPGTTTVSTLTDGTASLVGGALTGLGSLGVDQITIDGNSITASGNLILDGTVYIGGGLVGGVVDLQMSGTLGLTGTRVLKGWFTDLEVTNAIVGSITGNAATVSTITGLAPDTATTAAAQPNITSVGTLTSLSCGAITSTGNSSFSGNVGIGTSTFGTGLTGGIAIGNGTAGGALADAVQIWAADVSSSSGLHIRDESGGITTFANGRVGINIDDPTTTIHAKTTVASTDSAQRVMVLERHSSGTIADGAGGFIDCRVENSDGNGKSLVRIGWEATDITSATEDGDFYISVASAGGDPVEYFRLESNGQIHMKTGMTIAYDL